MKIVMVVNSKIFSGLENVTIEIMEHLNKNFEFIYVTRKGSIIEVLKEKKLKYYVIDKMNANSIKKMLDELKPDIIHAHDYRASFVCSLVKKRIPLVIHLHNNPPWLKKIHHNSFAFLFSAIRANKVLVVSNSIENEFVFSKFIKNKILNISNPISVKKISQKVSKSYSKKYDLCCVARISKQKNPLRFLSIIKKIVEVKPNLKAVWVGDGELKYNVLSKVKEYGLEKNVEFVGFQRNPYKYIAESKIFVLTSSWEGFGLVAFEALSLGVPCLVSKVGGLVDIVDQSCGYLCENDDDFVNNILKLLENNEFLKIRDNCKKKAQNLENIKEYMSKLKKIYEGLI